MPQFEYQGRTFPDIPGRARLLRAVGFSTSGPAPADPLDPFALYLNGYAPWGGTGYLFARPKFESARGSNARVAVVGAAVGVNAKRDRYQGGALLAPGGGTANLQTTLGLPATADVRVLTLQLLTDAPPTAAPGLSPIVIKDGGVTLGGFHNQAPIHLFDVDLTSTILVQNNSATIPAQVGVFARVDWSGFVFDVIADVVLVDLDQSNAVLSKWRVEAGAFLHDFPEVINDGRRPEPRIVDPGINGRLGRNQGFGIGLAQEALGVFPTDVDIRGELVLAAWDE